MLNNNKIKFRISLLLRSITAKQMMKVIELNEGMVCVISRTDYHKVKKYSWRVSRSQGKGRKIGQPYAATIVKKKKIYMHRLLLGFPENMVVDHINNQTLDNRRENLRIVTQLENRRNAINVKKKKS